MEAAGSSLQIPSGAGLSRLEDSDGFSTCGDAIESPSVSLVIVPLYAQVQVACRLTCTCIQTKSVPLLFLEQQALHNLRSSQPKLTRSEGCAKNLILSERA